MKMRYFIIVLALATLITTAYAQSSMQAPTDIDPSAANNQPDRMQQRVLSFNLEGVSDKGEKKWGVKGESAESISDSEIKLDNIVAKSYGSGSEATITADKGTYDKSKNNVRLEQNVKATIENAQGFSGSFSGMPIPGADTAKSEETASDKSKKTKTTITCDGDVLFEYEKNQASFSKNVKVINNDGNIDADKITVYLEPATKKVTEIVAEGNVKITRGENITYSDKATYVDSERKVVLSGSPKLVIYQGSDMKEDFLKR